MTAGIPKELIDSSKGGEDEEDHDNGSFRMPRIEYCVTLGDLMFAFVVK